MMNSDENDSFLKNVYAVVLIMPRTEPSGRIAVEAYRRVGIFGRGIESAPL